MQIGGRYRDLQRVAESTLMRTLSTSKSQSKAVNTLIRGVPETAQL
jgi:hypothetical protein